jgi:hypothetical protein
MSQPAVKARNIWSPHDGETVELDLLNTVTKKVLPVYASGDGRLAG